MSNKSINRKLISPQQQLMKAVSLKDCDKIVQLLSDGVSPDEPSPSGETPFQLAIRRGHEEVVRLIIDSGKLNIKKNEKLLWRFAVNTEDFAYMTFLISNGVDVDMRNFQPKYSMNSQNGETALMQAGQVAGSEDTSYLSFLISNGADINLTDDGGVTALMKFADIADVGSLSLIIEHGADINCQDNDGNSALHWALDSYSYSCGYTIYTEEYFATVRKLIESGINVNLQNKNGETALIQSLKLNRRIYLPMILLLIRSDNSMIDIKDRNGLRALDYAIRNYHENTNITFKNRGDKQPTPGEKNSIYEKIITHLR